MKKFIFALVFLLSGCGGTPELENANDNPEIQKIVSKQYQLRSVNSRHAVPPFASSEIELAILSTQDISIQMPCNTISGNGNWKKNGWLVFESLRKTPKDCGNRQDPFDLQLEIRYEISDGKIVFQSKNYGDWEATFVQIGH